MTILVTPQKSIIQQSCCLYHSAPLWTIIKPTSNLLEPHLPKCTCPMSLSGKEQESDLFYTACFYFKKDVVLCGENRCEHMQTSHIKVQEIAHQSTDGSGEDACSSNSVPCRNHTHDLLALKQQCRA